jgi:hypothetical protein
MLKNEVENKRYRRCLVNIVYYNFDLSFFKWATVNFYGKVRKTYF